MYKMQTHNLLKDVKINSSELEQTNKQIGIDENKYHFLKICLLGFSSTSTLKT